MKVVNVMTAAHGGAGIAAMRLHRALRAAGCDSSVLCLSPPSGSPVEHVEVFPRRFSRFWERAASRIGVALTRSDQAAARRARLHLDGISFSELRSDYDIAAHPLVRSADIVHLHWVGGFLDWPSFFSGVRKPVVWTLHDMNPFLGGFHYEGDRGRASPEARAFDEQVQIDKVRCLQAFEKLHVVCPSAWLASLASTSRILGRFRHSVIRNTIEGQVHRPFPQDFARDVFDLPRDARLVLTAAEKPGDIRKGADLVQAALNHPSVRGRFRWIVAGNPAGMEAIEVRPLGVLADERMMALAYSAADFFIIASREENLPNVVIESLSVGTPVIALPVGGIPEMVQDGRNGILAPSATAEGLVEGLCRADTIGFDRDEIRRDTLATYDPMRIAGEYMNVYESLRASP